MTDQESAKLQQLTESINALRAQVATLSAFIAATSPALSQADMAGIVALAQKISGLRLEGAGGVIAERTVKAIAEGRAKLEADRAR